MSDLRETIARTVMETSICGLTVEGERVFCDDPRVPIDLRSGACSCKQIADAILPLILKEKEDLRERAGRLAERDVDWTSFGKRDVPQWDGGADGVRDYRIGIVAGRSIASAIRSIPLETGVPGFAGRAGGADAPEPVPVSSPSGRSSLTHGPKNAQFDLVKTLRFYAECLDDLSPTGSILNLAAAEIERLQGEVAVLTSQRDAYAEEIGRTVDAALRKAGLKD